MYDEHQRRISEVDQVEKHLLMAKAASLAAEEKALSTLDQHLGLPKGEMTFIYGLMTKPLHSELIVYILLLQVHVSFHNI